MVITNKKILFVFVFCSLFVILSYIISFNNLLSNAKENKILDKGDIKSPEDILIHDDKIFLLDNFENTIAVIDDKTNKLLKIIKANELLKMKGFYTPRLVSFNPNKNILYISSHEYPELIAIDINTDMIISNFSNIFPKTSRLNPMITDIDTNVNNNNVYITTLDSIKVVDGMTHHPLYDIPLRKYENKNIVLPLRIGVKYGGLYTTVVNGKTNTIYTINDLSDKVSIIDNNGTVKLEKKLTVVNNPMSIAINENTNMIYILNKDGNRISIIDGEKNTVNTSIIINRHFDPTSSNYDELNSHVGIEVNPHTNLIYVSHEKFDSITVINGKTNEIIKNIKVDRPEKIAIDSKNNKIYSINHSSDSISIIDGKTNELIGGKDPDIKYAVIKIDENVNDIKLNLSNKTLYIFGTNHTFKIDKDIDKIVNVGSLNGQSSKIVFDYFTNEEYSYNCSDDNNEITIKNERTNIQRNIKIKGILCEPYFDGYNDKIYILSKKNLTHTILNIINKESMNISDSLYLPFSYTDLDIDPKRKLMYFLGEGIDKSTMNFKNYVWVIDLIDKNITDIISLKNIDKRVAYTSIKINPFTGLAYLLEKISGNISVVDEYTNDIINTIKVESYPEDIYINFKTNQLYVTNTISDTISIIDGTTHRITNKIDVSALPHKIAINEDTNFLYILSSENNNFISLIDGNTNRILLGINFKINPSNGGYITCNSKKISNITYIRYPFKSELECIPTSKTGFGFDSWSGNLVSSSTEDNSILKLTLSQFGNLSANFIETTPTFKFEIPPDTYYKMILIVITALVGSIIGWLIPSIIRYSNKLKQKPLLIYYMDKINTASSIKRLEKLRKEINRIYADGKIDSENLEILDKQIATFIENFKKL